MGDEGERALIRAWRAPLCGRVGMPRALARLPAMEEDGASLDEMRCFVGDIELRDGLADSDVRS